MSEPEPVVVSVVGTEVEAELACALLREEGIKCGYRVTNAGAGALGMSGAGGAQEILVAPADAERARELLEPPEELQRDE